jgi:hypothetical protein
MLSNMETRRNFIKNTLLTSGLVFSGITGITACKKGDSEKDIKHWDVVVIGGGPGGIPAAVAAARNGAKVLLVEKYGFLGGMATSALVHPYMKYKADEKIITRGLFEEFVDKLYEAGAILDNRQTFEAEEMKCLLDDFVMDSGVDLLLHTQALGVLTDGKKIKAVRLLHKGGVEDIRADIFIDSSGDGDIALWSGAEVEVGRSKDGGCQPMTTGFRMANVDKKKMPVRSKINELYDMAKANGEINNKRENVLFFDTVHPDVIHFNTTRILGKSALNGWSLSEAEIEGRKQVIEMVQFLKKYVDGFENSYLMKIGTQIGVRESRRVMGQYVLNADDVLSAKHFDDGITCGSYPIDIHNPAGTGTDLRYLKKGEYYKIPYRCLVPNKVDNLIIASRCISSTHEAHSSLRVMPIVWGIGEAGGTAASMCIKKKHTPAEVNTNDLIAKLEEQGAFV